jgi:hypothetical protein
MGFRVWGSELKRAYFPRSARGAANEEASFAGSQIAATTKHVRISWRRRSLSYRSGACHLLTSWRTRSSTPSLRKVELPQLKPWNPKTPIRLDVYRHISSVARSFDMPSCAPSRAWKGLTLNHFLKKNIYYTRMHLMHPFGAIRATSSRMGVML